MELATKISLVLSGIIALVVIANLIFTLIRNFGSHKEKSGVNQEKISTLEKQLQSFKEEINKQINKVLMKIEELTEKVIKLEAFESKSPLVLSDYGKKLYKESGLMTFFEEIKEELIEELEKKSPKTRYDVQEMARDLMSGLATDFRFDFLKKYVYKNSKVDIELLLRICGIPLRDYYLEKHPEIKE